MSRLAIVASHVIQYQAPFYRRLAREPDLDLTVLYCDRAGAAPYRDTEMQTTLRWDVDLLDGYRHRFLRNLGFGSGYTRLINPGLPKAILGGNFDAVIFMTGWGTVSSLAGMLACHAYDIPFFLFGDSSFPPPEDSLARTLRAMWLRGLFRLPSGFMTSGVLNAEYYRYYGARPDRFFLLPWAVDNERFAAAARFAPGEREAMRERFGIGDDQVALIFSAKLLPRKDPMTLLRAVKQMKHRDRAAVVFLGEGELRGELERFARQEQLNARIAGFVNQADLARHYAMGDVFVLPSVYEPRGAVLNEAMACGLPVIVTDRCGSIGDIVLEGENAMIFPAGDAAILAGQLDQVVSDDRLRAGMAARSREIIATWDYERGVRGVRQALEAVRRRE